MFSARESLLLAVRYEIPRQPGAVVFPKQLHYAKGFGALMQCYSDRVRPF